MFNASYFQNTSNNKPSSHSKTNVVKDLRIHRILRVSVGADGAAVGGREQVRVSFSERMLVVLTGWMLLPWLVQRVDDRPAPQRLPSPQLLVQDLLVELRHGVLREEAFHVPWRTTNTNGFAYSEKPYSKYYTSNFNALSPWWWWSTTPPAWRGSSAMTRKILRSIQIPWIHERILMHLINVINLAHEWNSVKTSLLKIHLTLEVIFTASTKLTRVHTYRHEEFLDLVHSMCHAQITFRNGGKNLNVNVQLHGQMGIFWIGTLPQLLFLHINSERQKNQIIVFLFVLFMFSYTLSVVYLILISHGSFSQHWNLGTGVFLQTFNRASLWAQNLPYKIKLRTKIQIKCEDRKWWETEASFIPKQTFQWWPIINTGIHDLSLQLFIL